MSPIQSPHRPSQPKRLSAGGWNTRRAALYLRVSTLNGQTTENQRLELEQVADRSCWHIVSVFEDAGISGAKGRDKRPGLDRMLKGAARREFDLIAVWSVDRLGRSLQDLVATLNELNALGCDLYLHQQAVDTTTPAGRALFQMMGVFAEFERAMIRERVTAGLARARAQGKRLGRPPVSKAVIERIRRRLDAGFGIRKTAALEGVGVSVVQRVKAITGPADSKARISRAIPSPSLDRSPNSAFSGSKIETESN